MNSKYITAYSCSREGTEQVLYIIGKSELSYFRESLEVFKNQNLKLFEYELQVSSKVN